ncbi:MarR family transcriptional regulator [bacterium D16-51]|nr:MarR family transcriptional regulator [bacterium D16-59]RKI62149.1 MarR family transcriptional regulator [bacterium D16-51]
MSEANTFGMLIRQIHNALEKIANSQLKAKDLTLSQMTALVEILKAPTRKLTFKELEKCLSLAQSTTAGLIFRLEQKKLVSVSGDTDDKRIKYVEITPVGEKFCKEAKREIDDTEKKLLENLSAAERESLLSLLEEINRTVRKM